MFKVSGLHSKFLARTHISLANLWEEQGPDGPDNADIEKYLKLTGSYPYYRDAYYDLEDFRNEYEKTYGKPPFTHRAMQWQWNVAKQISVEERDKYWRRSELYRHWLLDKVFEADNKDCITIMVLHIEVGKPSYRDAELPPYYILSGYASLNMAPMMRAPELTAIIGEITYNSIVTKREEPFPIGVSVIGAPGTDLILADLVERGMTAGGFPTALKTGRSVY